MTEAQVALSLVLAPLLGWLAGRLGLRLVGLSAARRPGIAIAAACAALAGGVLWLLYEPPVERLWRDAVFLFFMVALATADGVRFRLPDQLTFALVAAGLLEALFFEPATLGHRIAGAAIAFLLFCLVAYLYRLARGREGLGFGDAKLMAGIGACLGWADLPAVIFVGSVAGLLTAAGRHLAGRPMRADLALPFGSFLALGGWLARVSGPMAFAG